MTAGAPFPQATLETERLRIRQLRDEDVDVVARACGDELTQRWLPLPRPYGRADALEYIGSSETMRLSGEGLRTAVALRERDELVASVSLKKTDWRGLVTEVGYWAVPEHRRCGYVSEAVGALSRWALAYGMARVELLAAPGNSASNRVAGRAGFRFEGLMRDAGFVHGGRVDLNLYSLIRADLGDQLSGPTPGSAASSAA